MKVEDLISIVIPVYNAEKFLDRCLSSVITQRYQNLEVIIINDGSTDQSGELLAAYQLKDKRITVTHTENSGVSAARNLALEKVNGSYVTFIDSDDSVHPDYILELYKEAKKHQADIVCCGYNYVDKYTSYTHNDFKDLEDTRESFIKHVLRNTGGTICSKLFKFSIIKDYQLRFDINLTMREDLIFALEFAFLSQNFFSIENYHYNYNGLNEASLSKVDHTEQRINIHKMILQILDQHNLSPVLKESIINSRIKEILWAGIWENMASNNPIKGLNSFFENREIDSLLSELKISGVKEFILYAPSKIRSSLLTYFIFKIIYGRKWIH